MSGKERPILFSGPMVRAILDGRKTQTRRAVKGQALDWLQPGMFTPGFTADPANGLSPYGYPGDRLWVRETWQYHNWTEEGEPAIRYAADDAVEWPEVPEEQIEAVNQTWADLSLDENYSIDSAARDRRWRPSIHMPRWACRLVLEVTDVRVERLQAISESDCCAEGCGSPITRDYKKPKFEALWSSINGAESWAANPWVWAITFRRLP
jgi:hypothetical protein